ncbi:MAG: aminoglycoside phosphotransferase family protein [Firmicutes bacterium]|nr:aminoglycoside phosphotransferase family protein [Bacillota bacterium]
MDAAVIDKQILDTISAYYGRADLDGFDVSFHEEGLCNRVVVINRSDVFRFPRADWALPMLKNEIRLIGRLRSHGMLSVGECKYENEGYGVFSYIEGVNLSNLALKHTTETGRLSLARDMGRILGELHSFPTEGISSSGAKRSREDWLQFYKEAELYFPRLISTAVEFIESVFAPIIDGSLSLEYRPRLIHGDLAPYHVKADLSNSKISGLIDFGEAGIGDPATDISCLIYNLGLPFVESMDTYPYLEDTLERAIFYARTLEVQWFVQAVRTKDPFWFGAHLGSYRG